MVKHEWLLKRNCALSPRQFALAYAILFFLSLAVAAVFVLHGAWIVLAFALAEMAGAAVAFLHYARHASDLEHIALTDGCLLIERVQAGRTQQIRLDPYWTRVATPKRSEGMIQLEAHGVKIQVGRFVAASKRQQFARELRQELQSGLSVFENY
jgi:uncharacterized membrane protein